VQSAGFIGRDDACGAHREACFDCCGWPDRDIYQIVGFCHYQFEIGLKMAQSPPEAPGPSEEFWLFGYGFGSPLSRRKAP